MPTTGRCAPGCTEHEHYGADLRAKGLQVAPSATPSQFRQGTPKKPKQPTWEKTIPTEKRPGGFEMPYLNESGDRVRIKEFTKRRREIDAIRHRHRNAPKEN